MRPTQAPTILLSDYQEPSFWVHPRSFSRQMSRAPTGRMTCALMVVIWNLSLARLMDAD